MADVPMSKKYERTIERSKKQIMIYNFLGGISWGVGSIIGATIVVAFIIYVLIHSVDLPVVGEWIQSLLNWISQILEEGSLDNLP